MDEFVYGPCGAAGTEYCEATDPVPGGTMYNCFAQGFIPVSSAAVCFMPFVPAAAPKQQKAKTVTSLRIAEDCWSLEPNVKTLAPYRKTRFAAYDGEESLAGDPDIVIQEAVVYRNGRLATDVIDKPDSMGAKRSLQ